MKDNVKTVFEENVKTAFEDNIKALIKENIKFKDNIKTVFMGTPEFAVPALEAMHSEFEVCAAVTVPDKPKGRGRKMQASAVKQKALELGIPVLQPEKLKDTEFLAELKSLHADVFVVLAFRILPEEVYTLPKFGTFNIHTSLLPKYRGAAPINWAILNGDKETGLTSFLLKKTVDTGDILMQQTVKIPENSTAGDLHDLLMPEAAKMATATVKLLVSGEAEPYPQQDSESSPAPKIFAGDCQIKWTMHARDVRNFIHGMSPVPGAWTIWNGERLKILRTEYSSCGLGTAGEFFIEGDHFLVNCGKGMLYLKEIQLSGKKAMSVNSFLKGYRGEKKGIFETE